MKTSRIFTLLAVFLLSFVLVTAVLAGAGSARHSKALAEGFPAQVFDPDIAPLQVAASGVPASLATSKAVESGDVPAQSSLAGGIPTSFNLQRPPETTFVFDSRNPNASGGAPAFAQDSGSRMLSSLPMPANEDLALDLLSERAWGVVNPGEVVTITVNGTQMGAALADGVGFFWTTLYDEDGLRPGLSSGDQVRFYADGSQIGSVIIPEITGEVDIHTEQVVGQIDDNSFEVTVYANDPTMTSDYVTSTLDASGFYTADFSTVWDFRAWDKATVAAVKDGIEILKPFWTGNALLVQPAAFNTVLGRAEPGAPVTVTLYYSDSSPKDGDLLNADENGGWEFSPGVDINETDYVVAEFEGGMVISRTVDTLSLNVDTANDRITGNTVPNTLVRGQSSTLTSEGWKEVQTTTLADGTGVYTLQFSVDLMPESWGGVFVADADGDDLNLWNHDTFVRVNQTWDDIWGLSPFSPGDSEGRAVTLTLSSTSTQYHSALNWAGRFDFNWDNQGAFTDIAPGDIITINVADTAWQGVVQVSDISAGPNVDTDEISGDVVTPTNRVEVSGEQWGWDWIPPLYPIAGSFNTLTSANSPFTVTAPGFDLRSATRYNVQHRVENDFIDEVSGQADYLRVWPRYNGTLGSISPAGTPFTITLKEEGGSVKATLFGESGGPAGDIGWQNFGESGEQIVPGDYLVVESGAGFYQEVHIPEFEIQFNPDDDRVVGNVLPNTPLFISVDNQGEGFVPTMANGDFVINVSQFQDFYGDGDLDWGNNVMVCFADENGNQVCVNQEWPSITARYQMDGWNDVSGMTSMPENTIQVTVTDDVAAFVDSGSAMAGACEWCGPDQYQVWFPDYTLQPDYRVTADFGGGFVDYVDVAEVTGNYNIETDVISGTVPPNSTIFAIVENEGGNGPQFDNVEIDGSGEYSFDFGAEGWDIQPGDYFHIYVPGRHNHQTEYVFYIPYSQLQIQKENTPGHSMPGSPILYKLRFWVDGNGVAENIIITDTIPLSTTYLSDTSGYPVDPDGNMITWTVGDVPPGSYYEFFVALEVGSDVPLDSELEQNCAWIRTDSLGDDPGDNFSCSGGGWITEGETGLWIQKWPEPGDPHPGQEFEYILEYGSDGGVATGSAWITDTLPDNTEVLWWFDENGWDTLWTEVITTGGKFALYAPAGIPGDLGGRIHLRLALDESVEVGTVLENSVVITTDGDMYPDNNTWFDDSAVVSTERYDVQISKSVHNQVPIAGWWLNYFIDYRNQSNIATEVIITDTLPDGVTYESAFWGGDQPEENQPLPEPTIDGNQLIWSLGNLDVNQNKWFHIQVNITDTLSAGEVLTNCVTISSAGPESTPEDNTSCTATTLNEPGPNLAVWKQHDWRDNGGRLEYRLRFENIGDETINNVWLTDTLPISTTWDGWWDMSFDWERLLSEDLTDSMLRWEFSELFPGDSGEIYFGANLDDPNARPMWYTNSLEITIPGEDISPEDNFYEDIAVVGEVSYVDLYVNTEASYFSGESQPGAPVTVTTPYTETYAFAEWDCNGCWDIQNAGPVWPGDPITVTAGAGLLPIEFTVPEPFTTEANSDLNQVWGQIDHLDHEQVEIQLDGFGSVWIETDEDGNFNAGFPDISRRGEGEVLYHTNVTYADVTFHNHFRTDDLLVSVNYAHDWVNGNYEAGHTVWLTVTESDGMTVKGTAQLSTGAVEGWDQPGFSTNETDWNPGQPDILVGDWVFGFVDTGFETEVRVGEITGNLDVDTDSITGTVDANWWLPETVDVFCHPWGSDGGADSKEIMGLLPNGAVVYGCGWDPGSEWDIQPGQDLAVEYVEPDGDSVYNVFQEPTPYLQITKNANGAPGEGGNFAFTIEYINQGDADAENVVITDTLHGPMTYISDTSGLSVSGSNPFVWELGTLSPGDWIQFQVFVQVDGTEGEWITNTAQIETSSFDQAGPEEKYAEWNGQIEAYNSNLNIGKNAWTGDPAPSETFIWSINACNDGTTPSSQVTLTDTLPISTTLQDWLGNSAGWSEVSLDSDQLVLSRPTIESGNCEQVYLTFLVDALAEPGMEISNTAAISATNDNNPDDNESNESVWVGEPHTNINTNKWWNWGQLVPGGTAEYSIEVGNSGNTTVDDIVITDTLPVSSTLVVVKAYDRSWNYLGEVSADQPEPGVVVWDVGTIIPGDYKNYQVQIDFDPGVAPGTVITNRVEVSSQPSEDSYEDNVAGHTEEIFTSGPNLRIRKSGNWEDRGNHSPRATYSLSVENIGDGLVTPVTITDTYPASLYMEAGVNANFWRWWDWTDHPDEHYFTVTLESLYGGESMNINFALITDTDPIPEGVVYTNFAEVSLDSEDTNPGDNQDSVDLVTGPDLYVNKTLIEGEPVPGELLTFAIDFGNKLEGNQWWWQLDGNAWLTDTLPAGMTYITSTLSRCDWKGEQWCGFGPSQVNGSELGWEFWPFGPGEELSIHLTVQLTDTAANDEVFFNLVEISSTDPANDTEYDTENNTDSAKVVSILPDLQASFDQSDTAVLVGETVYFTDTSTTDIGEIVAWEWDFGDSSSREYAQDVSHAFATDGDFDVTLVVTDTFGFTDTYSQTTHVCEPITEVSFTYTPQVPIKGETISFTATITPSGASTPVEYVWDFGDGDVITVTQNVVTHTFANSGTYTVEVTASNACTPGVSDEDTIWIAENRFYLPLIFK